MKDFNQLPDHSKVWIYQSNRPLLAKELSYIESETEEFLGKWQSHGADMDASYKIILNRFLVVSLDETSAGASGCGIDKLFHHIKKLELQLQISFFDRLVVYYTNKQGNIELETLQEEDINQTHISSINQSAIHPNSHFFDNTITTKEELNDKWLCLVSQSWITNYIDSQH